MELYQADVVAISQAIMYANRTRKDHDIDVEVKLTDSNGETLGIVRYAAGTYVCVLP